MVKDFYFVFVSAIMAVATLSSSLGQGSLTPSGPPAPTMKSLQEVSDKLDTLQTPRAAQKFTGFADANATGAGLKACSVITIPAGQVIKLESVAATTYSDAGATAYLKFIAKVSSGVGRIMVQRIPIVTTADDPVVATRSGSLQIPLWLIGGGIGSANIGEVYSLSVCVQSSASDTALSSFVLTGSYAVAP